MGDFDAVDAVFTWVDDRFPGYAEQISRYGSRSADLNPNRTRDDLKSLKYGLRSLEKNVRWIRNVYVVTCSPQVPAWLDISAQGLKVVHHDAFIDPAYLPTFNSFAIVSHLHLIDGLSERFLYVEDDMLFGRRIERSLFEDADGRIRIFPRLRVTEKGSRRNDDGLSPWNAALAQCNFLLDEAFGPASRHAVNHVPLMIDKTWWREMIERWPDDFARTRASRFRGPSNVAPEYLYLYFLACTGRGAMGTIAQTYRHTGYAPLENLPLTTSLALRLIDWIDPELITLNDGFGANPRTRVLRRAAQFLEARFPVKSRFEKR